MAHSVQHDRGAMANRKIQGRQQTRARINKRQKQEGWYVRYLHELVHLVGVKVPLEWAVGTTECFSLASVAAALRALLALLLLLEVGKLLGCLTKRIVGVEAGSVARANGRRAP